MERLEKLLEMWEEDSVIDYTEPGRALLDIPKLHSKYLNILSRHRLLSKQAEMSFYKMRNLKKDYYSGRLDEETLEKYNWEQFPFTVLKTDISNYLDGDDDVNKSKAKMVIHNEIIEVCTSIMKELHSRTYQLKSYIDYEKFIQGA